MVENENDGIGTAPAGGAPTNRDRRPHEPVIEGEVAPAGSDAPKAEAAPQVPSSEAAEATAPESAPPWQPPSLPPEQPKAPGAGRALVAGAVGGAIVAALAATAFTVYPPKTQLPASDLNRIAALEAASSHNGEAIAGLDQHVAALAALEKRVGALEAGSGAAGTPDVQALSGDVKTLRGEIDATREQVPALEARIAKLETAAPPDISARIQKLETEAAAPKPATNDHPAAVAVVAEAIRDKLASGAPFTTDVASLASLGVDPAKLAPLKAVADGAPSNSALIASFEAAEPKLFAAVAPKEAGSVGERLLGHLRSLVRIRQIGETAGDDPQALASQVVARLQRGDLSGALAAFAKLPQQARDAASAFAAAAGGKQDAVAAVQAIRDAAVARLAESDKP